MSRPDGFEVAEFLFLLVLVFGWSLFIVMCVQGLVALCRHALRLLDE